MRTAFAWASVILAAFALGGCSREKPGGTESVAQSSEALSVVMTRTYGFESLTDWSAIYSSPTLALSNTRTEGLKSLAVSGGGWSSFISRTLAKEEAAPTVVGFDLRIPTTQPNPTWYGTVELYVDIPSRGVNNQPLGLHMLTLWTPGQWRRAEFSVPAAIQTAMNQSYTDLRWRIQLNVPSNSTGQYLFDRFAFGGTPPACTPVNDGNPCTMDQCNAQGQPVHIPVPAGTSCTDMNACNGAEVCNASAVCVAGTPTTCAASDQCHDAGTCNPATGVCSNPAKANGAACSDGNACTQSDTCQAGACTGANPVTCVASDQCHLAGTCNTSTGVCSNPAKADGATCSDANSCTQSDTCQSGTCIGANPVTCVASDACHLAGTCDTSTGACSNPAKADGSSCADATVCNGAETCSAGTCVAGTAPAIDDGNPCTADSCHAVTGVAHMPVAAGTACADADLCNGAETCNATGTCVAGTAVVCSASDQCHVAGTCNASTGACTNPAKADGSSCSDANACTQSDTCQAGACVGASPVVCAAMDACHIVGTCDASTGVCSNPAKADGTSCADATVCNGAETCSSGSCVAGGPPVVDDANPCTADACDPVAGVTHTPVAVGTSCSNGDACDGAETCDSTGLCAAGTPVSCIASDQCHLVGTCNPATGACSNPTKPDGSSCSDGNGCTTSDACQAGACVAGNPVACAASDSCHGAGVCDPTTGACSDPVLPNGTACDDATICNGLETCTDGTCTAGTPIDVDDDNPCTADACDPVNGAFHDPVAAGTSCETDGNTCNGTSACDGAGVCQPGAPPVLDDENPCTADACDPLAGVTHTPVAVGTSCSDANACNGDELCNAFGACLSGPAPELDDGSPCTVDVCDPLLGVTHTPVPAGTSCANGTACDGTETCDAAGICQPGVAPELDDGNPCTLDTCDATLGVAHTPAVAGTSCADGDVCNGAETCDGGGTCAQGTPPVLTDDNPCTDDFCDPTAGVSHTPRAAGASCSDFDLCNGSEACDAAGVCLPGTPVPIDTSSPCTTGTCDPLTGIVTYAPSPAGTTCAIDVCTDAACNGAGQCSPSGSTAQDDGDPCTLEWCDPVLGPQVKTCPTLDRTVGTTIYDSTRWIYEQPTPPQVGVVPGTISVERATAVRGFVRQRSGDPLPGVKVVVTDHTEYGYTLTHSNGYFDLVVNGGGDLILDFSREDFLSSQRMVTTTWGSFVTAPDVVLVQPDPVVTPIDLTNSGSFQVAAGSIQSDTDGLRSGKLLVPPGAQATMHLAGGGTVDLAAMNVRISEFTVGSTGHDAMPAPLPPTSKYTYAFEVNADEAVAAGAPSITFSVPLPYYVENFIDFPAGTIVPVGSLDRTTGTWSPEENGVVLDVVAESGALAQLDVTGDGVAETAAALSAYGITNLEREKIAELYDPGQSLWRIQVGHFTRPWDCNWSADLPPDADEPPPEDPEYERDPQDDEPHCNASTIGCQSQTLFETLPIAGTDFSLHYSSARVPGRLARNKVQIPISGSVVPASLRRIELDIEVGGVHHHEEFAPLPDLEKAFVWDGRDAFGRYMQGQQVAKVAVAFIYPAQYSAADRFGSPGNGITLAVSSARAEVSIKKTRMVPLGKFEASPLGIGGWTLNVHHAYLPATNRLELGTGSVVDPELLTTVLRQEITTQLSSQFAVAPDKTIFWNEGLSIRRTNPDQTSVLVAGPPGGGGFGYAGDGIPATDPSVRFRKIGDLELGRDGTIFIADTDNHVVRKISPNGIIHTIVGIPESPGLPIAGPAAASPLSYPTHLALGRDGSLFVSSQINIVKLGPDGILTIVAGSQFDDGGQLPPDGTIATDVMFRPGPLAIDSNGTLHFAMSECPSGSFCGVGPFSFGNRIVKVVDGRLYHVAGAVCLPGNCPSTNWNVGDAAKSANLRATTMTFDALDGLQVATGLRIAIIKDGIIATTAGTLGPGLQDLFTYDGAPATNVLLPNVSDVRQGPNGLYFHLPPISVLFPPGVMSLAPALPSQAGVAFAIASQGAPEVFSFDASGRHLATIHSLVGSELARFTYDAGQVIAITDESGNVTTVERDAGGNPVAIVSPFGQRTEFEIGASGYLEAVIDPLGNQASMGYNSGGLLTSFTNPRGGVGTMQYDADGRLEHDEDPAGGTQQLVASELAATRVVTRTTGLGHQTNYTAEALPGGAFAQTMTGPDGVPTGLHVGVDRVVQEAEGDGTIVTSTSAPDIRFGLSSPVRSTQIRLPSGLLNVETGSRSYIGLDPENPFSFQLKVDDTVRNGSLWRDTFDAATRTFTLRSPIGRISSRTIDTLGRVIQTRVNGFFPTDYQYDANGRLFRMIQGTGALTRTMAHAYVAGGPSAGYLETITDPRLDTTTFTRDSLGRVLTKTRAGAVTSFDWDEGGNRKSVIPPGKPNHDMAYTPVNLLETYDPPAAGVTQPSTSYTYDLDRMLRTETRPDGVQTVQTPDGAGRLDTVQIPGGLLDYAYYPPGSPSGAGRTSDILGPYGTNLHFTYDGRLVTSTVWSGAVQGSVAWQYNSGFRKITETVTGLTGTSSTTFGYDTDQLLTCVSPVSCSGTSPASALRLTRDLQRGGIVTQLALGSTTETFSYNGFGEIAQQTSAFSGSLIARITYDATGVERDRLGRIVQKTEVISGTTKVYRYTYDALRRLTDVTVNGALEEHFEYDLNGNRTEGFKVGVGTWTGTYDDQDRLLSYGPWVFTYTANGELETKTNTDTGEEWLFEYDALGNLLSVGLPNGDLVEYHVDGLGRRVGKLLNGVLLKQWIYRDDLKPVAEFDGAGQLVSQFAYGSGTNVPNYVRRGGATYRVITDQLGSPRHVVNVNNASDVPYRADYASFGGVSGTGLDWMPFGFAGGIYDSLSGLVRFGARDYDPLVGRWISKDPSRFAGGVNLFAYANNDPTNFLDPEGRGPWFAVAVFAGCELDAAAEYALNWYEGSLLEDELLAMRKLRELAEKQIMEKDSCGEDSFPLMERRDQLDREITRLAKEYAKQKAEARSDLGQSEIACAALTAGALLIKTP